MYDKYFQNLFDLTQDETFLVQSGYLKEGSWDKNMHLNQLTTPLHNIIANSGTMKEVSVLLYPGCFAPIHEGHLEAMQIAKRTIEQQTNEIVVAGYFAPDHDDYVQSKTNDIRFDAPNRVQIIQSVISDSDWMEVEPWAALHATQSLNFTTLYDRFIKYLSKWLPDLTVKVYLVFGEDNILFANAYLKDGHAVCVLRAESNYDSSLLLEDIEKRTLYSTETPPPISSSAVRNKTIKALPEVSHILGRNLLGTEYILRDDLELALSDTIFHKNTQEISKKLYNILNKFIPENVTLSKVNVITQTKAFSSKEKTISLDPFWIGTYNLHISRLFNISDHQKHSSKYINRPGSPSLEEQLKLIPIDSYVLVDDDIASGTTMTTVETLLNSHGINIHHKTSLIKNNNNNLFDVVDARDFIIGAAHGGLVVQTPLGITRVPYLSPFVNLTTRAKLNAQEALDFSQQIWILNYELYLNSKITVGQITNQDFTKLGFTKNQTIEEICKIFIR
jgi:nicotinic acid mononucleotide adenylyltransferase